MPKIELDRHDKYADNPKDALKADAETDKSLEAGLMDTFPASDPVSEIQPSPSIHDIPSGNSLWSRYWHTLSSHYRYLAGFSSSSVVNPSYAPYQNTPKSHAATASKGNAATAISRSGVGSPPFSGILSDWSFSMQLSSNQRFVQALLPAFKNPNLICIARGVTAMFKSLLSDCGLLAVSPTATFAKLHAVSLGCAPDGEGIFRSLPETG